MRIASLATGLALAAFATLSAAETFMVRSAADDGSRGTLRWAIEASNQNPGNNRIEFRPAGRNRGPMVIQVESILPPIKGEVVIAGLSRAGDRAVTDPEGLPSSVGAIIDGSNVVDTSTTLSCSPETGTGGGPNVRSLQKPGLAIVDSGRVEISGLEIRNFCVGILVLRSRENWIHHNVIHDMVGAAGVLVTGDAGDTAGSSTTDLSIYNLVEFNVIYDTGDGAECTRGTSNSTYQHNLFFQSSPNTVSPRSQGMECAGAADNIRIIDNIFLGFSDGLQLNAATNVLVDGNLIANTTYGITAAGTVTIRNNVITGNRMGIGPGNAGRISVSQNSIYNNGQPIVSLSTSAGGTTNAASPALLGIDVGVNGVTANDSAATCADGLPDCDTIQNFATLSPVASAWTSGDKVTLRGSLASRPSTAYTLEFYANHALNPAGFAEGEVYLGSATITTDVAGNAEFLYAVPTSNPLQDGSSSAIFTVLATNPLGRTSEFSPGIALVKAKILAAAD